MTLAGRMAPVEGDALAEMSNGDPGMEDRDGASPLGEAAQGGRTPTPVLSVRHLSKTFGGERALDDLELSIAPGEIHGLLGENGSGKSTLIKVLGGYHAPDPGAELQINGQRVELPLSPGQFRDLGLSFVHQNLGLVPELSVVENLRIGEVVARRGIRISWRKERRAARAAFDRFGVDIDPATTVSALSPTDRALLAIVRAVEGIRSNSTEASSQCGLLVLDEPTVFLPRDGVERLFEVVREIASGAGASVLFVSHDLAEVRELTDRVTVLRDGRVQGTMATGELSESQLVELIVGRRLEAALTPPPQRARTAGRGIEIRNLRGGAVDVDQFEVHPGEIVGLTGLAGSGFELVPYLLFGALPCSSGTLRMNEARLALTEMTPARAIERNLALLPADRLTEGCQPELTVSQNMMISVLGDYVGPLGLRQRAIDRRARTLLEDFDVRPPNPSAPIGSLSGGNQQKAVLAKWLQTEPELILLHEPTQGVDVGARAHIFDLIRGAAERGAYVLCASTDHEQLAAICDRVAVFSGGRISRTICDRPSKESIAEAVYRSLRLEHVTERKAV